MDAETLEALKGSIRKWEAIVDGTGKDKGSDNCPLCKLFLPRGCTGCPVMEKTGIGSCLETPYVDYRWAAEGRSGDALTEAFRELDFLRSLMPESTAPATKKELVEDDVSDEKKFWAVTSTLNKHEWLGAIRCQTKEEAEKKAMKLVSQHGGTHYVLECVGVATAADVKFESVA